MEIVIVIAESCISCNTRIIQVMDRYLTQEEITELNIKMGGMYCIKVDQYKTEIGKVIETEIRQ